MKKVLYASISSTAQQPFVQKTHEYYNSMSIEATKAIIQSLIPSSAYTGKLIILNGCTFTGTNPGARTVSEGWVYYNGEIYYVPQIVSITTTGSDILVWSINTAVTQLEFTDSNFYDVHQEKTFVLTAGASGSALFDETSSNIIRITNGIVQKSNLNISKIVIPIGTWDMDSTGQKQVNYSSYGIDYTKVISLNFVVFGDSGGVYNPFNLVVSGVSANTETSINMDSSSLIYLERRSSGFFDSSGFSTLPNRGYITIEVLS